MKLHLACGDKKLPGFVNVDFREEVHPDVVADIRDLSMFKDGSAEVIYFCHGMEHFMYKEVPSVLKSFKRILAPNGDLYLAVPDFGAMAAEYVFGMMQLDTFKAAMCGGQEYEGNTHYSLWDRTLLERYLRDAGFIVVQRYNPKEFLPKGFWDYSMFSLNGELMSLNMRATC